MLVRSPLVVRTYRGPFLETESIVHASVSAESASDCVSFGPTDVPFPTRSTIKPFQAGPLLSGDYDVGVLTPSEAALACGSHNGEDGHAQAVSGWLDRLGLSAEVLLCPPALPMTEDARDAFVARGGTPERRRHDCSGKHCGFLSITVAAGCGLSDYLRPDGYVQTRVTDALRDSLHRDLSADDFATDGCGAPTLCVPLAALARGWRALAERDSTPLARAVDAMRQEPWYLAGTGRFDTEIVQQSAGTVLAKVGASGVHAACVVGSGVGVAVKSLDGCRLAAQVALGHILRQILGADLAASFPALNYPTVANDAGLPHIQVAGG